MLANHAGNLMRVPKAEDLHRLTDLRKEVISLLMLLLQLSSCSMSESASTNRGSVVEGQDILSPAAHSDDFSRSSANQGTTRASASVENQLSSVFDAIKKLVSGSSGDVEVTVYSRYDERSKTVTDAIQAYRHLRSLVMLSKLRGRDAWYQMLAVVQSKACVQVTKVLHRALTTANPGAEPVNVEAQRQLLFFCNSLHNRWMPKAPTIRKMRTCSSFTPHYSEDVSYSVESLKAMGDDGVNLGNLLQVSCSVKQALISMTLGSETTCVLELRLSLPTTGKIYANEYANVAILPSLCHMTH